MISKAPFEKYIVYSSKAPFEEYIMYSSKAPFEFLEDK